MITVSTATLAHQVSLMKTKRRCAALTSADRSPPGGSLTQRVEKNCCFFFKKKESISHDKCKIKCSCVFSASVCPYLNRIAPLPHRPPPRPHLSSLWSPLLVKHTPDKWAHIIIGLTLSASGGETSFVLAGWRADREGGVGGG